jgi:hypothetical protein
MSYNDDIWYRYRMEVMFNGEWREVGTSGDQNQALSILSNEYGGRRDFRLREAVSDRIVAYQDRTLTRQDESGASLLASIKAVLQNLRSNETESQRNFREQSERFRREMMGEWAHNSNTFFREVMNERPVRTSNEREYQREMDRYENRRSRLSRFGFVNSAPVVMPPQFVRIAVDDEVNTFKKVSEPREKVNWKEEGF